VRCSLTACQPLTMGERRRGSPALLAAGEWNGYNSPPLHLGTRSNTAHQSLLIVGEQPLTLATGKLCVWEWPGSASPVRGASWSAWAGDEGNDDLHPITPQRPSHAQRSSSSVEQCWRKNHRATALTALLASKKLNEAPSTAPTTARSSW
jgi:hypothetical protein